MNVTCGQLQPYTLHFQESFHDLPNVLLLHLLNFDRPWSGNVCCHHFEFPDRLSMAPYMTTKPGQMEIFIYELYTVVVYEKGFHSTVYVRELGQWYQYSKDEKMCVEALFVHAQKANLLGYTRAARNSAPSNPQVRAGRKLMAWAPLVECSTAKAALCRVLSCCQAFQKLYGPEAQNTCP